MSRTPDALQALPYVGGESRHDHWVLPGLFPPKEREAMLPLGERDSRAKEFLGQPGEVGQRACTQVGAAKLAKMARHNRVAHLRPDGTGVVGYILQPEPDFFRPGLYCHDQSWRRHVAGKISKQAAL